MNAGVGSNEFDTEPLVTESETNLPSEPTAAAAGFAYNAFVSYSHAADGLQRFATPWAAFRLTNPVRSLRVFQDQASLSANPALWLSIGTGTGPPIGMQKGPPPEAA